LELAERSSGTDRVRSPISARAPGQKVREPIVRPGDLLFDNSHFPGLFDCASEAFGRSLDLRQSGLALSALVGSHGDLLPKRVR
jgi:hypothetical protein